MQVTIKTTDRLEAPTNLEISRGLVANTLRLKITHDDGSGQSISISAAELIGAIRAFDRTI